MQIYQKTYPNGTFGQINFSTLLESNTILQIPKNSTLLVGTFDEFSIHLSPSIFYFSGRLEKDNFLDYFYPINETAANVINTFLTGKYVKFFDGTWPHYIIFLITCYVLMYEKSMSFFRQISVLFVALPLLVIGYLFLYWFSDILLDITASVVFLLLVQYLAIPFLAFSYLRKSELVKNELINAARIDALLLIAEKLAHDIRSPLSSINLVADNSPELNSEKRELILSAVARVDLIAQNILDKEKNAFANFFSQMEVIDLGLYISKILEEKYALSKSIRYDIMIPQGSKVLGNPIELGRVVSNILDNSIFALKEVDNPSIEISAGSEKEYLEIAIKDNGSGIPPNILRLLGLMRVTTKSDDVVNKSLSGSGIGLLNAKRTIEKMNGRFQIQSEFSFGTTVTISLLKSP